MLMVALNAGVRLTCRHLKYLTLKSVCAIHSRVITLKEYRLASSNIRASTPKRDDPQQYKGWLAIVTVQLADTYVCAYATKGMQFHPGTT